MKRSLLILMLLILQGCAAQSEYTHQEPRLSREAGVEKQGNPLMDDYVNMQERERKRQQEAGNYQPYK